MPKRCALGCPPSDLEFQEVSGPGTDAVDEDTVEDATHPFSWEQDAVVINDEVMDMEVEDTSQPEPATCSDCGVVLQGPVWWCVSSDSRACPGCAARDAAGYWLRAPEGRPQGEVAALLAALKRELDLVTVKEEPAEIPAEDPAVPEVTDDGAEPEILVMQKPNEPEGTSNSDPLGLEPDDEEPDNEKWRPAPAPEQVVPAPPLRVTAANLPLILLRKLMEKQPLTSSSVVLGGRRLIIKPEATRKRKSPDQAAPSQADQNLASRLSEQSPPSQPPLVPQQSSAPQSVVKAAKQSPAPPLRVTTANLPLILLRKLREKQALVSSSLVKPMAVRKRKASHQPPPSQLLASWMSDQPLSSQLPASAPAPRLPQRGPNRSAMRMQADQVFTAR